LKIATGRGLDDRIVPGRRLASMVKTVRRPKLREAAAE
jgi:hypothetical protein